MTNPIKSKFFNINRPSIALVIIAWVAFNFNSIFLNYPITIIELLIFFLSLFFLEIIFIFFSNKKINLFFILNTVLFLLNFRSKLSYQFVRTFNAGKMNLNHLFQLIILFSKRF